MTPGVRSAFEQYSNSDAYRYVDYWGGLRADTPEQLFQRFLFAYLSVHTSWEGNVMGYEAIKNYEEWLNDDDELETRLRASGAGLYNNRTRFIGDFAYRYWRDPAYY